MKKYLFISVIALLSACQPSGKKSETITDTKDATSNAQLTDTAKVYNAYLKVKDHLVKTDGKAVQQSADSLAQTLSAIKGCKEAEELATKMAATNDIKSQRTLFLQVSQDVIPLVKGIKNPQSPIYVAYCPMTNEGKGGYWLSAQKEIKNPYYGDEMLECGEVKEEIK
ncbi:DUF3347 domain-containing protein [Mucilaginibacter galii]|uniref:DUF3347 domain-containing protein n=1 Tax=Mucilaginibacter galii TaxID=2005073 RepID=A0A917N1R9_9SPHI|nr:DUF3347 domain-containing protein [Mucilaginibacter galii]GGI51171.1 hypothetical protein GCM10011425_23830 [Mucilaginibacter galii]